MVGLLLGSWSEDRSQRADVRGQKSSYSLLVIGVDYCLARRSHAFSVKKTGADLNGLWERLPAAINALKRIFSGNKTKF